jgi:starch synthase
VVGFAKTGGLADVAGALPRALAKRGCDCAVILPLYRCARRAAPMEPVGEPFEVPVGGRPVGGRLWRSRLPDSDVPVYLVEHNDYFDRDDPARGRGLYQAAEPDGRRRDYGDNAARFIYFCRAVLEAVRLLDLWPDVLHCNDWQTGLIPVFLREVHGRSGDPFLRERWQGIKTLFTIHNIAYQGHFWHLDMNLAGLDWRLFNHHQLEFHGGFNFLKAGLVYADYLSTVSPTYAREIQTPYYGCGMQGLLSARRDRLFGIVNGVDYGVWDPATDPHLPAHFTADAPEAGKAVCKAALQQRLGLTVETDAPLFGVVARLVEQKGVDLIFRAAWNLIDHGAQLAVLGEGDPRWHAALEDLRRQRQGRVGLYLGFDEGLAHQIEAGSDMFLMPSLYEPSGLNQLYSMRYGTPPVVRSTGGLADTVTDASADALVAGTATGFRFAAYSADALLEAAHRGMSLYRARPDPWGRLVRAAMRQDWSWDRSAVAYEQLYKTMTKSH